MRLELKDVFFKYQNFGMDSKNGTSVLTNVSLTITQGTLIGIVGASGSGKTTLLQIMNGLLKPNSGHVLLDNQTAYYKGESFLDWHKKVGLVSQFPEIQFFENTIFDEIAYGLRNRNISENDIETRIKKVLRELDLDLINAREETPFQLSQGQKRRIAIASILVMNPEIIIFDEPTSALDFTGIKIISKLISKLHQQNRTVIMASHDMDFIYHLVDRIIALHKGKIIFDGSKKAFFSNNNLVSESKLELPRILQSRPF